MKRILFGLTIAVLSTISSTIVEKRHHHVTGSIYVHSLLDTYNNVSNYEPWFCLQITNSPCAYSELSAGQGIVTSNFTSQQALIWVQAGYLMPLDNGIYLGL